jgi:ParB family protein of integrating conjugative element (PFGI_1 class)
MTDKKPPKRISREQIDAAINSNNFAEPARVVELNSQNKPKEPESSTPSNGVETPVVDRHAPMLSLIRLSLDQVEPYENNPRTFSNEKYKEIEESIRVRGLDSTLWVAKRPGHDRYVLAKGGGTRYAALMAIFGEKYELDFKLCDYKSDEDLLVAHLSENLHRGDMCYWDKACGVVKVIRSLRARSTDGLTHKEVTQALKEVGLPEFQRSTVFAYEFAFDHLTALGNSTVTLTTQAVNSLQIAYNDCMRLVNAHDEMTEEVFNDVVWDVALNEVRLDYAAKEQIARDEQKAAPPPPDWHALIASIAARFSDAVGIPPDAFSAIANAAKHRKDASWAAMVAGFLPEATVDDEPTSSDAPVGTSGQRLKISPTTYPVANKDGAYKAPDDGDRPPQHIVEQVEAEQRARRNEAQIQRQIEQAAQAQAVAPAAAYMQSAQANDCQVGREAPLQNIEAALDVAFSLATRIAGESRRLAGCVIRCDLPMGWMIDVPQSVLDGDDLPPKAKQIFWVLAHASFQLGLALSTPSMIVAESRFAKFVQADPQQIRWDALRPTDGFDSYLIEWLLDPGHEPLGSVATKLLQTTRSIIESHPARFMALGGVLNFADVQAGQQFRHAEEAQQLVAAFVDRGASNEMIRSLFPGVDVSDVRFRPGRPAEIDLRTLHRVYAAWERLIGIPRLPDRYLALHEMFSAIPMAALFTAISASS